MLINPDNPSGNYIEYNDCIKLIVWAKEKGISLIIDESFVDFVDNSENTSYESLHLIMESVLNMYENLFVIKSISKSYGVPNARLGVLVSSNEDIIEFIKKDMNIKC